MANEEIKKIRVCDTAMVSDSSYKKNNIRGHVTIKRRKDGKIILSQDNMIVGKGRQWILNKIFNSANETRTISRIKFGTNSDPTSSSSTFITEINGKSLAIKPTIFTNDWLNNALSVVIEHATNYYRVSWDKLKTIGKQYYSNNSGTAISNADNIMAIYPKDSPIIGDKWLDLSTYTIYTCTVAGSWINASSISAKHLPLIGDHYFNTTSHILYTALQEGTWDNILYTYTAGFWDNGILTDISKPAFPTEGKTWYDKTINTLYTYNNRSWNIGEVISTSQPSNPINKERWFNTLTNLLYTYTIGYWDSGYTVPNTKPSSPVNGNKWYNISTNLLYTYISGSWNSGVSVLTNEPSSPITGTIWLHRSSELISASSPSPAIGHQYFNATYGYIYTAVAVGTWDNATKSVTKYDISIPANPLEGSVYMSITGNIATLKTYTSGSWVSGTTYSISPIPDVGSKYYIINSTSADIYIATSAGTWNNAKILTVPLIITPAIGSYYYNKNDGMLYISTVLGTWPTSGTYYTFSKVYEKLDNAIEIVGNLEDAYSISELGLFLNSFSLTRDTSQIIGKIYYTDNTGNTKWTSGDWSTSLYENDMFSRLIFEPISLTYNTTYEISYYIYF